MGRDVPPVRETFWWHALYASNVQIVVSGEWPGAISHFWSLAVEEQFYLAWPWLIVFAPRRWLVPAIVAAIAVAPRVPALAGRRSATAKRCSGSSRLARSIRWAWERWLALAARDHRSGPDSGGDRTIRSAAFRR